MPPLYVMRSGKNISGAGSFDFSPMLTQRAADCIGERLYFIINAINTAVHVKLTLDRVKTPNSRNIFKIPKSCSNLSLNNPLSQARVLSIPGIR